MQRWLANARSCARAGKRLCTQEEWSAACRGDGGKRKYAYGDHYEPSRCHDRALSQARHTTAPLPTGTLDTCVTPEGVYDLSGNVWEWLADTSSDGKVASYLGGGFFNDDDEDTQSCQPEDPNGQPPASRLPAVGFRCCKASSSRTP